MVFCILFDRLWNSSLNYEQFSDSSSTQRPGNSTTSVPFPRVSCVTCIRLDLGKGLRAGSRWPKLAEGCWPPGAGAGPIRWARASTRVRGWRFITTRVSPRDEASAVPKPTPCPSTTTRQAHPPSPRAPPTAVHVCSRWRQRHLPARG